MPDSSDKDTTTESKDSVVEPNQEFRNLMVLCHLSYFLNHFLPFAAVIINLVVLKTRAKESRFIEAQAKEAFNFNLTYMIAWVLIAVLFMVGGILMAFLGLANDSANFSGGYSTVPAPARFLQLGFGMVGMALFGMACLAMAIWGIASCLIAAVRASKGENYHYKISYRFIK